MSAPQAAVARPLPSLDYGVGAGVALLVAGLIGFGLARAGSVPLRMDIYGELGRISPVQVREAAAPMLVAGFFQLDGSALEDRLRNLPWVRSAVVERLWPDRVAVHLTSYRPLALWGEDAVLSDDGSLVRATERPAMDLHIEAPASRVAVVFADLQVVRSRLPEGWQLARWTLSATGDRQAVIVQNDHRITLEFGREPVAEKFKLLADIALPVLQPRLAEVAAVDLRYRNGFAVRWLDGTVEKD